MTSMEMARKLAVMFDDVLNLKVTPDVANAAANAAGKLMKLTELQHRFAGSSRKDIFALPPATISE